MSRLATIIRTFAALACTYASFAQAQSNETPKSSLPKKNIRVAADLTSMPWYGFDSKTGTYTGFEYDYALEMFAAIDSALKVEIVPTQWERIADTLSQGKADVGFNGFFLPPEKERISGKFDWSNCYFKTSLAIIYLKKNGAPQNIDDLKKKRVTIFTDEAAIAVMKKVGIKKYTKSTFDYKFVDFVMGGKTDFAILDKVAAQYMAQKQSDKVGVETTLLTKQSEGCYAVFATKNNKALIEELNKKGIPALQKRSKEILAKYGISE